MNHKVRILIIVAIILIPLSIGVWGLYAAGHFDPPPQPKFQQGELVTTHVGNRQGMVLRRWCEPVRKYCQYKIRFAAPSVTADKGLFGHHVGDLDIQSFSTVIMDEWELQ